MITIEELVAFEKDIADAFNQAAIRAPIHLDGGNEEQLIKIFKDIRRGDWVCGSWRMHYKCLLHGVPSAKLKSAIMAGRSITLCFPEHRIISSAIVGGILPIALGIAWSINRNHGTEKVFVFVGDMTAQSGMYDECIRYAMGHDLPIKFIIEDNGRSVCTDTQSAWGWEEVDWYAGNSDYSQRFRYILPWPHSGAGRRVEF